MSGILLKIKDRLGPWGFFTIRRLEHLLSPSSFYSALVPLAFARTILERIEPLPGYLRRPRHRRTVRQARMSYLLSRILEFIPDRLRTSKWRPRFQTSGFHHIEDARKTGRGAVLVCFHFGTYKLIPFWLRALGIPVVALLGGRSEQRSRAKRLKDQLSPFPEIPTVLYSCDQLRGLIDVLSAGHVLLLAADQQSGRQITVPIDNHWSFSMATGAIRLASHCDAELIPCRMTDQGRWHFRLEIARPVPREYLANEPDMMRAGQHLLREMLPCIRNQPEQCAGYLLNCFRSNVRTPVAKTLSV